MNLRLTSKNDFDNFKSEIRNFLLHRKIRTLENPGYRRSAVQVLLLNKESEPHVLVTKRTNKVSTHKGEMSLPGGGYDDIDQNILDTAYRETFEETGIPRDRIEHMGQFDDYISIFGFHVSSFIGAIPHPIDYNFNKHEIEDYVEVPLELFVNRKYQSVENYNFQGTDFRIYHYYYKGFKIWGLTARILTDFGTEIVAKI